MGVLHVLVEIEHRLLQLASSTPFLVGNLLSAICYALLQYLVIGSPMLHWISYSVVTSAASTR